MNKCQSSQLFVKINLVLKYYFESGFLYIKIGVSLVLFFNMSKMENIGKLSLISVIKIPL